MEAIDAIFVRPYEVTQFWASERYLLTSRQCEVAISQLFRSCPAHVAEYKPETGGDWYFEVVDGDGGPFAGDFLPPILPTRSNIRAMNQACLRASALLGAAMDADAIDETRHHPDDIVVGIEPYRGVGPMCLCNEQYRTALWQVLHNDWGICLPNPKDFCRSSVVIFHRTGMPGAAAMVRAVQPLLEAAIGEDVRVIGQSSRREGGRVWDSVEYETKAGSRLVQRFDITEVFGREELDWRNFSF